MKRLLLTVAILIAAAFCLPLSAQAAVTCTDYFGGSGFPGSNGYIRYCGDGTAGSPTSTQAGYVFSALNGAHGLNTATTVHNGPAMSLAQWFISQKTSNAKLGTIYLFKDHASFYSWAATNMVGISHPTADGTDGAATHLDPTADGFSEPIQSGLYAGLGPAIYTVVFTNLSNGQPNLIYVTTAQHELGHYMDWLFGNVITGSPTGRAAQSAAFSQVLAHDWTTFKAASPVQYSQCYANGGYGIFSNRADDRDIQVTKHYICNGTDPQGHPNGTGTALNAPYAGDNEAILKAAWSYYFGGTPQETWSEEYAEPIEGAYDYANAPWSMYYYFNFFPCSTGFVNFVVQHNAKPTSSNTMGSSYPAGCPLF